MDVVPPKVWTSLMVALPSMVMLPELFRRLVIEAAPNTRVVPLFSR